MSHCRYLEGGFECAQVIKSQCPYFSPGTDESACLYCLQEFECASTEARKRAWHRWLALNAEPWQEMREEEGETGQARYISGWFECGYAPWNHDEKECPGYKECRDDDGTWLGCAYGGIPDCENPELCQSAWREWIERHPNCWECSQKSK